MPAASTRIKPATSAPGKTADGKLHLLFGNLEEGFRSDAVQSRHITLELPSHWRALHWRSLWDSIPAPKPSLTDGAFPVDMPPASSILFESQKR